MPNPKPVQTDGGPPRDSAKLIRELAVKPPVKGMANMKAATDIFEANLPIADRKTPLASDEAGASAQTKRRAAP